MFDWNGDELNYPKKILSCLTLDNFAEIGNTVLKLRHHFCKNINTILTFLTDNFDKNLNLKGERGKMWKIFVEEKMEGNF